MKTGFFTTARITGLLYLGLAITGMFAFLFAKSKLYVAGDAAATVENLSQLENLARMGIAAEVALVAFQALAAVWFFKLFHKTDLFAALSLTLFGMVNATIILIASVFWMAALYAATTGAEVLGSAPQVLLLFEIHELLWLVGKLFFGLWLIPMGYLALKANLSKGMAWLLIAGGAGYILSTFLSILTPNLTTINELLPFPATIGEFWMIGYLVSKEVRE